MEKEKDLHFKPRKRPTRPNQPDKPQPPEIPILLNPPEKNFFAEIVSGRLRRRVREIKGGEPFDSPLIYGPIKRRVCLNASQKA